MERDPVAEDTRRVLCGGVIKCGEMQRCRNGRGTCAVAGCGADAIEPRPASDVGARARWQSAVGIVEGNCKGAGALLGDGSEMSREAAATAATTTRGLVR